VQTNSDAERLQFNSNLLADWSKKWQLAISCSKSAMLNVGRNELNQAHEIDEVRVKSVSEIRDLGIIIDIFQNARR
jgi:hypothetical protein